MKRRRPPHALRNARYLVFLVVGAGDRRGYRVPLKKTGTSSTSLRLLVTPILFQGTGATAAATVYRFIFSLHTTGITPTCLRIIVAPHVVFAPKLHSVKTLALLIGALCY